MEQKMYVNDKASSQGAAGLVPLPSQFERQFKRSFRMSMSTKEPEEARPSHLRSRHDRFTCGFPAAAGLEQPGRGQPAGRRSSSLLTPHLQSVSAAHEGFPCHAHISQAIAQFFAHAWHCPTLLDAMLLQLLGASGACPSVSSRGC